MGIVDIAGLLGDVINARLWQPRLFWVWRQSGLIPHATWDLREKVHAAAVHLESHLIISYTGSQLI